MLKIKNNKAHTHNSFRVLRFSAGLFTKRRKDEGRSRVSGQIITNGDRGNYSAACETGGRFRSTSRPYNNLRVFLSRKKGGLLLLLSSFIPCRKHLSGE